MPADHWLQRVLATPCPNCGMVAGERCAEWMGDAAFCAARIHAAEVVVCRGCGKDIDPDTCGCGTERQHHSAWEAGHQFIPAGCDCFRADPCPGRRP